VYPNRIWRPIEETSIGDNTVRVLEKARWDYLKTNATSTQQTIGALIEQAMLDLEAENPPLKGVLTKNYARPELDQTKLGDPRRTSRPRRAWPGL
jgi:type I restriction enzyme M protein